MIQLNLFLVSEPMDDDSPIDRQENAIAYSLILVVVSLIILMFISIGSFLAHQKYFFAKFDDGSSLIRMTNWRCRRENAGRQYDVQRRHDEYFQNQNRFPQNEKGKRSNVFVIS